MRGNLFRVEYRYYHEEAEESERCTEFVVVPEKKAKDAISVIETDSGISSYRVINVSFMGECAMSADYEL